MRPAPAAKQFRRGAGGGKYWPGGSEGFYYSVVVKKEVVAGYITSLTGDVFTSPFYLLAACIQTPKNALEKKSEGNTSVTVKKAVSSETALGCIALCLEVVPIRLIQGYLPYGTLEKRKTTSSDLAASEAFTGKEFEDASGLYYFGARWFDPELGIWLVPDAAGEFHNPYARGGDPINFVDADGNCELICAAIIIGAIAGAYIGGAKANNEVNPADWHYENKKTWAYIGGGALIGGVAGGTGAAAGAWATGASGLSAAEGTAGIAGNSGLIAATTGGAVGGAVGGGVNYAGFYGLETAGGDREWNTGEFFTGFGISVGTGALIGGAIGATSYGLSNNARNLTHKTVEDYGFARGQHTRVVNYDFQNNNGQRAVDYYLNRVLHSSEKFTYQAFMRSDLPASTRGSYDFKEIYDNAFYVQNSSGENIAYDPTGLFGTIDHELAHGSLNTSLSLNAGDAGSVSYKAYVESGVYFYGNLMNSAQHSYSPAVTNMYEGAWFNAFRQAFGY